MNQLRKNQERIRILVFLMKTHGSLRGFEIPRTSGSFVFEGFQNTHNQLVSLILLGTQKLMVV